MANERMRNPGFSAGPATAVDEFDETASVSEGNVSIVNGMFAHSLPLAGMTLRQARGELSDRMNIDPEATGYLDGNEADEDTVLNEGQVLSFVKHAGEKGAAA